MVLACSCALLQRLDEYPLKSVKDLFMTPATEGKEKVREEIEFFLLQCFDFHLYKDTLMKMTPHIVMNLVSQSTVVEKYVKCNN